MKLIKINPYRYVIVDDSEIKEGDWVVNINGYWKGKIAQSTGEVMDCWEKITHSTEPFTNDFIEPLVLSEVEELLGEVDVEKKILDLYNQFPLHPMEKMYPLQGATKRFIEFVYNQALEDNKEKKYTEKDLKRYHNIMCLYGNVKGEEYIQSLQPKTEWEVEFDENNKLKLI